MKKLLFYIVVNIKIRFQNRIKYQLRYIIKLEEKEIIDKMKKIKKPLIGLIAGIICGFFASGGGLILVPAFIYLLKMEDKKARGTAVCCILPMVITSSIFYYKQNYINWKIGIYCAIGGIAGGIIGAKLLKKIPTKYVRMLFTAFLLYVSFKMLF